MHSFFVLNLFKTNYMMKNIWRVAVKMPQYYERIVIKLQTCILLLLIGGGTAVSNEIYSRDTDRSLEPIEILVLQINENLETRQNVKTVTIKGNVSDIDGYPLPGVNIRLKDSTIGAITDVDGIYSIDIPKDKKAVLTFSFLGLKTVEEEVGSRTLINVVLIENAAELGEVTVVAYGRQKKASVVGAISTTSVKPLKAPVRSLSSVLAGNLAGIIGMQRSGEPGGNAEFWIRGVGTFGAGARTPLVMVDGIERSLDNIEPEDIEEFSVLKDAAATAIYGVRGANGAILITTKKGSDSKPDINFKYERGVMGATQLPDFINGAEYAALYNEAYTTVNPGKPLRYTQEDIQKYADGSEPYIYPNVDWMDTCLKDWTSNQRFQMSVTGGGKYAKYYVSGSYYSEDGLYKQDALQQYNSNVKFERFNFRMNTDIDISKDLLLTVGLSAILIKSNYPAESSTRIFDRILKVSPIYYPVMYPGNKIASPPYGESYNPYGMITQSGYQNNFQSMIQSNLGLKYDFKGVLKGLSTQVRYSFDTSNYHNILRKKRYPTWIAVYPYKDENGELILQQTDEGDTYLGFSKDSSGDRKTYLEASVHYSRTFGNHNVGALFLYNHDDYINAQETTSIGALPRRHQGIAGRLTYSYADRYFTEFNFGYNGSENFEKGKRFGFFPSAAVGWSISEEPFFSKFRNIFQLVKLRASYGLSGNDNIGGRRFAYLTTMGGGNGGYMFGGSNNNFIGGIGEDQWGSSLTWEKSAKANIGIDFRFGDGFFLQGDVFMEKRRDIFLQQGEIPSILGTKNKPWGNLGKMENRGFDATLEYQKVFGNFGVNLKANYSYARNKVTDMNEPDYYYPYQNRTGHRFNEHYGLIALGLFEDQADIDRSPRQEFGEVRPGDIKYMDLNSDGVINGYDQIALGNSYIPEIVYGFGGSFTYKGFDLSVFFQGIGNTGIMMGGEGIYPFQSGGGNGNVYRKALDDHWSPENPDPNAYFPRLYLGTNANNYQNSTYWLKNGSFLRLKSAEIGYTIAKKITSKFNVGSVRIYLSGFNLLTWSSFDLWDPELGSGAGTVYPTQRTINLGINVNL